MSCDGSSAKSYIRHATEKERLDNLAFASFPEDYLPYAANPGHHRVSAPPPYLLWGEDRRRRPTPKRRKPKCAGALLCAIALVILAIIAVIVISVYLGVVTNLFRSPVVSVSGRFTAAEDFSNELLNSSSPKFLEKAEAYKSKDKTDILLQFDTKNFVSNIHTLKVILRVEKAFISSSIEPAFIAARVYSFRPGLIVFFRVYLDRRKLKDGEETPPTELVRDLVAQRLASDPESVHVEENEELLSVDIGPVEATRPPLLTTGKPPKKNGPQRPSQPGVGEWRPVPIEDSVSPSFGDGSQGNAGPVRPPEGAPVRNSAGGLGSVRVLEESPQNIQQPPQNIQQPSLENKGEGVGSVRVIEESPRIPQQPFGARDNTGSVRLSDEISPRNPLLPKGESSSSASGSGKPTSVSPLRPSIQREGTGTVRLLDESPPKPPQFTGNIGIGSVSVLDDNFQSVPKLPENVPAGIGSVHLIDESPPHIPQNPTSSQGSVGLVRVIEDNPPKTSSPFSNPSEGYVRPMEDPPTLSPSVSLVIRNRTRSERPKSLPTRLAKIQQNGNIVKNQNVGASSIREIVTEESLESLPLRLQREPQIIASRLLDLSLQGISTESTTVQIIPEINDSDKNNVGDIKNEAHDTSTEIASAVRNNEELVIHKEIEVSTLPSSSQSESIPTTYSPSFTQNETSVDVTTSHLQPQDMKVSPLENILFNHAHYSSTTAGGNMLDNTTKDATTETLMLDSKVTEEETFEESTESGLTTISNIAFGNETESSLTTNAEEDIHSSIVNYSQYLFTEPHYHTIENEHNKSLKESFEAHTLEGHGFHKPSVSTSSVTPLKVSNSDTTSQMPTTLTIDPSTLFSLDKSNDEVHHGNDSEENVSNADTELSNDSEVSQNSSHNYEAWSGGDDAANGTIDDAAQQAKVVPQFNPDFLSNDIGEEQESDDESSGHKDEILRHITTLRPQVNGADLSVEPCPPGRVPCDSSGEKCGVRCDLRRDCPNNVDEAGCTCSDLLRAMGQSQKICDGVDDCSDGSDEAKCPWCSSEDHFICPGSRACVSIDKVCDGKDDCPGGQDEKRCVSLANSSIEAESLEYRPEGHLIVRKNGRWGKLCLDTLVETSDLSRRIADLGKAVCSALTYKNMSSVMRSSDTSKFEDSYYEISSELVNNRSSTSSLFESTPCKGKEVLKVKCMTLECGLRPSASTQRRRIVGGRSVDGTGSWPWAAALYREGEFQCGGALINDLWLVSASHCFYSSQHAYWSVRLGVLRRGSELRSGGEHVRRIENIILHPEYEDTGFINDIALLKMDRPVPFSDILRPICLPSPEEDASVWHGERCSVVGWGKLHEIGHTFPDTLQEVRLPVISSAECQRRSIFLPAYHITSKMFCAGYDRGGRDACLGDSGGPMACQRSSDGRWVLLGITSNGDGCGRPGRPGVYSQVAGFLTWIQDTMSKHKESRGHVSSESVCTGVRCRLGRCIQKARVCDGRRDCAGGEDEARC